MVVGPPSFFCGSQQTFLPACAGGLQLTWQTHPGDLDKGHTVMCPDVCNKILLLRKQEAMRVLRYV